MLGRRALAVARGGGKSRHARGIPVKQSLSEFPSATLAALTEPKVLRKMKEARAVATDSAGRSVILTRGVLKGILARYDPGTTVNNVDAKVVKQALERHPLYDVWLNGRSYENIWVESSRTHRNPTGRCFVIRPDGDGMREIYLGYKYCLGTKRDACERIYISAVQSLLETSQLRNQLRAWAKAQRGVGTEFRVDVRNLALGCATDAKLNIYNVDHLKTVVFRNLNGYWSLTDEDFKKRVFKAVVAAISDPNSIYLMPILDNPNRNPEEQTGEEDNLSLDMGTSTSGEAGSFSAGTSSSRQPSV